MPLGEAKIDSLIGMFRSFYEDLPEFLRISKLPKDNVAYLMGSNITMVDLIIERYIKSIEDSEDVKESK
jgi:hypothetical protein